MKRSFPLLTAANIPAIVALCKALIYGFRSRVFVSYDAQSIIDCDSACCHLEITVSLPSRSAKGAKVSSSQHSIYQQNLGGRSRAAASNKKRMYIDF
ncbi:hypothetical protein L596_020101 [Steinernema carpocapsae]|uniref:Uncharacterized protein n=1 Tax=Steinernema carpocapsae TaxID=34508 RepID=A0A4U5MSI9_STECR|nr:hypothetical protein L596_020101 [Steinernema carpocapsae]